MPSPPKTKVGFAQAMDQPINRLRESVDRQEKEFYTSTEGVAMKLTCSVLRICGLLIALLVTGSGQAVGASIGLFSTPDCSSCNLTIHQGEQKSVYVSAPINDAIPQDFAGGEFRITGVPSPWTVVNVTRGPGIHVIIGDPLGSGVVFSVPDGATSLCTRIFTIDLLATTEEVATTFRIEAMEEPSNPERDCPVLNFFFDTWLCAGAGVLLVNSPSDCSVSVTPAQWGAIKQLYRR